MPNQYTYAELSYHPKEILNTNEEKLKIGGLMLYWGEGSKKSDNGIDFANSDPIMISYFLKFFRTIYNPTEKRLRALLYTYHDNNIPEQIKYWSNITKIPVSQFSKPYTRSTSQQKHDKMPHGLVHVRYYDKRLLLHLMSALIQVIC